MLNSLMKIWHFSEDRHGAILKGLLFSFLRSLFGICQIFSIVLTVRVLTGNMEPRDGILSILGLTLLCIL